MLSYGAWLFLLPPLVSLLRSFEIYHETKEIIILNHQCEMIVHVHVPILIAVERGENSSQITQLSPMTGNSVSIQLDMSRNSHRPIFLNDSCVVGTVVVDNCNSARFDSVRVILEGLLYVLACLLQPSLGTLGFSPAASDLGGMS
ncbi:hypothetical protein I7I51_04586 [Histoplasma capsulatum]|uniref:Uncharacterized protein n=1 Tax=Ajellomyces capsulatus TaxID=5037 RepID=A0A8A1M371_AJECA|nr:hypothetical protein I7I51_04586 [Histoplasma capsulatum]